ncbi:MAG: hypothetical protein ACRD21_22040 [Vicinamibacteria bacterium]
MIAKLVLLLAAGFAISCRSSSSPWTELDSIEDLKEAFNRDSGKARIVLLLSPT